MRLARLVHHTKIVACQVSHLRCLESYGLGPVSDMVGRDNQRRTHVTIRESDDPSLVGASSGSGGLASLQ